MDMKKKVILIHPSSYWKSTSFPTGLFYIGSFLSQQLKEYEIELINLPTQVGIPLSEKGLNEYIEKSTSLLESKDFDYVGISCWTSNLFLSTLLTARIIKGINKDAIVVVGGYHPSVLPTDFQFENTPVDYIIVGEGELPLQKVILEGKIQETPVIIKNEESLNLDFYSSLNWQLIADLELSNIDIGNIYLSRGCPFNCNFCIERSKSDFKWRALSPESGISLIKSFFEYFPKIQSLSIFDPIFGFQRTWRNKFLKLLQEEEISKSFFVEMRVDTVDKLDLQLLANLNFRILFGIESFSKTMLEIMGKSKNPEKYLQSVQKVINWADELQLVCFFDLLLGHPGETLDTLDENKSFFITNLKGKNSINPHINLFGYFPGSYVVNNWELYESTYGTTVEFPEWWKIPPLYQDYLFNLSTKVQPSRNLTHEQVSTKHLEFSRILKDLKDDNRTKEKSQKNENILKNILKLTQNKDFLRGTDLNQLVNSLEL